MPKALAKPKSANFRELFCLSSNKFCGFRSRWRTLHVQDRAKLVHVGPVQLYCFQATDKPGKANKVRGSSLTGENDSKQCLEASDRGNTAQHRILSCLLKLGIWTEGQTAKGSPSQACGLSQSLDVSPCASSGLDQGIQRPGTVFYRYAPHPPA